MATAPHYPASVVPWQTFRQSIENHQYWTLELATTSRAPGLATLMLTRRADSRRWNWSILPVDLDEKPIRGPGFGYVRLESCEAGLLRALATWLHTLPAGYLPSQEGATKRQKEV